MGTAPTRYTLFILLYTWASVAFPARGMLVADGILRVKGADLATATMTIVPGGAMAYSIPITSREFQLSLPLNDTYLISFSRAGCPVKEVYFDTSVPVELHATDLTFPFQVTLEHLAPERMFAYAAPVGFVRYMHNIKDFGYETQYIVEVNPELEERMREVQLTGVDPKQVMTPTVAKVVTFKRGEPSTTQEFNDPYGGTLAPTVSKVPALVHVLGQGVEGPDHMKASADRSFGPSGIEREEARNDRVMEVTDRGPGITDHAIDSTVVALLQLDEPLEMANAQVAPRETRWESETITEPRRVIQIVREVRPNGSVSEYRKVHHAFGPVFYFHDTRSISEHTFEKAVYR